MTRADAAATREQIIRATFREVYQAGVSAASLERILGEAGVTKGALYHHFSSKKALCCAMVNEVIRGHIERAWVEPLRETHDPLTRLRQIMENHLEGGHPFELQYGCPLNNLAQEISAVDEELRELVAQIYRDWVGSIRETLARGQGAGTVRQDVDAGKVAQFVVSAIQGSLGIAKNARDARVLLDDFEVLVSFLENLRPTPDATASGASGKA